jgi:hypothetical protein
MEAALHNMQKLQRRGNSIADLINSVSGTFINYGSEFRPIPVLEPLLLHHPNWPKCQNLLCKGSLWPLHDISNADRVAKNKEFIRRGNHKSAIKYEEVFLNTITKEIQQGWMVPLPLTYINDLLHGELAPVGIDDSQWSILPDGSKKVKYRLTHDQSFEASVGMSVNKRVKSSELLPLYYGGCLSRLLHYIVSIRFRHPEVKILGGKSDFKSAYRRVSLHGNTAAQCSIMYKDFALPSLRLTFGGSPCPNEFCAFSELCTDLANDLLHAPDWDPRTTSSPHSILLKSPLLLDDSVEFAQAKALDVELPDDDWGRVDDFIDDGIVIVPDLKENRNRAVQSLLLAIHIICRPLDSNEHIAREDCLSLSKLAEEGMLSEEPIILGWKINTRRLTISLPENKYKRWNEDLSSYIKAKKISYKDLESLIGRLNHSATACPLMRYFLNRIRKTLEHWITKGYNKKMVRYLSSTVLEDLKLWHTAFLPKISTGLSLNLITFRRPSYVCWSDACPQGLGGYDHFGNAWRFPIPTEFHDTVNKKNNSLEFIAAIITVWIPILKGEAPLETCFLALCDNSSAVGWLHKANIDDTKNYPLHIAARKYADILLKADCCLYSQHIAGVRNNVADALSRKNELSDSSLTEFICTTYPSQVSTSFQIKQLPQEISSWLTSWLLKCKETTASQRIQKIKKLEFGSDGKNMPDSLSTNTTSGCATLPFQKEQLSWEPLQLQSDDANFLDQTKRIWQQEQCKRPWQNWVRSLGQTWGTTPHMVMDQMDSIQP